MSQHEVLMLVAAPLIVLGKPLVPFLWALPEGARARALAWARARPISAAFRAITAPLVVLLLHGAVLWIWHAPALFEAALASEAVHAVQHATFFITAALFWWSLIHGRYGRAGYGVAVVYVFATALHSSVLGALLTTSSRVWYPSYETTTGAAGLSPLEDQALAGLFMWVPAGVLLSVLGLALFAAWLGEAERRAARAPFGGLRPEAHVQDSPASRGAGP